MTNPNSKLRPVNTGAKKNAAAPAAPKAAAPAPAPKVEAPQTKRQMANPEVRPTHVGAAASTYRIGKKLSALRKDYRCGQMSEKDNEFLRDVVGTLIGKDGTFQRRNIDAGRLGRLYTLGFVTYDEIGVVDPAQVITATPKAKEFLKPVKAA